MDSTDRERLSISMEELHKMLGHEELSKAAILVFANKQVQFDIPAESSLVVHKRLWSSNYVSNCIFSCGSEAVPQV